MKFILRAIFLLLLTFVFSYLALSLGYPKVYSPLEHHGTFQNISGDRWLSEDSTIKLNNLASRGNQLEITFSDWHPEGFVSPDIRVAICGKEVNSIRANPGKSAIIYLTSDCSDKLISFTSPQSFSSPNDSRQLIHQIQHIQLSSRFGFPLVSFQSVLPVFLLILFLVIAVDYYFLRIIYSAGAALILALLTYYFYYTDLIVLKNFLTVAYFLLLGATLSKLLTILPERRKTYAVNNLVFGICLSLIILLAIALRLYGIDFGLPFNYHPDEIPKYNAIERMRGFGDLNPRYFLHPTLLLYATYFFNFILRSVTSGPAEWMETLILSGRIMSATAGVFSVVIVAFIARKLASNSAGLVASALLAVAPLHVTVSRYVKEDSLLLLFILAATYLAIWSVMEKKPAVLVLAGLACGFSASVKYTGLISVVIIWGAIFLDKDNLKTNFSYAVIASVVVPIGFLIASPYILLDFPAFWADFNYEKNHMLTGHGVKITAWGELWTYQAMRSLPKALTSYLTYAGLIAMGFLLAKKNKVGIYLCLLILLYYIPAEFVTAKPAPQPERYIVPVLPFLFMAIAVAFELIRKQAINIFYYLILLIIPLFLISDTLNKSLELASEVRVDTRDQMKDWLVANLPHHRRILVDKKYYNPQFVNKDIFDIIYLDGDRILEELHLDNLKKKQGDYLLISSLHFDRYFSQPNMPPQARIIIRNLFKNLTLVKKIEPKYGTYGFHNPSLYLFKL